MNAEKADANNNTVYLIDSSEISLQNVQVAADISVLFEFDIISLEQPLTPSDSEPGIVMLAPVIDINEHNYAFTCTKGGGGINQCIQEWHEDT